MRVAILTATNLYGETASEIVKAIKVRKLSEEEGYATEEAMDTLYSIARDFARINPTLFGIDTCSFEVKVIDVEE